MLLKASFSKLSLHRILKPTIMTSESKNKPQSTVYKAMKSAEKVQDATRKAQYFQMVVSNTITRVNSIIKMFK